MERRSGRTVFSSPPQVGAAPPWTSMLGSTEGWERRSSGVDAGRGGGVVVRTLRALREARAFAAALRLSHCGARRLRPRPAANLRQRRCGCGNDRHAEPCRNAASRLRFSGLYTNRGAPILWSLPWSGESQPALRLSRPSARRRLSGAPESEGGRGTGRPPSPPVGYIGGQTGPIPQAEARAAATARSRMIRLYNGNRPFAFGQFPAPGFPT